jgi:chaperonin GroEL
MAKPQQTVFYSWQSDSPPKSNWNFIEDALEKAVKALASKGNIAVDPVIDRDTRNVAGSPDITDTILSKIEVASVFVADVTIICKMQGDTSDKVKSLPNPNVLFELGYALKVLDYKRLILVTNTAYGRIQDLPFDLQGRRTLDYHLAEEHLGEDEESKRRRKQVKDRLVKELEEAILTILLLPPRDFNQLPAPLLILKGASNLRGNAASLIGPRGGRATVYKLGERQGTVTRDGITIAAQLTNQDHNTRQGIDLLSKAAYDAREQAGDGAKTALLICYEMVNGGYGAVDKGELLADVISGMERGVQKAAKYINKQQKSLRKEDIPNVAKTAGGKLAGELVVKAFQKIKPEGVFIVENQTAPAKSSVDIQEAFVLSRGFIEDDFANDETGSCIFEDCYVLVYDGTLSTYQQLLPLFEKIIPTKKPTLVIAGSIDGGARAFLLQNNRKAFSCVAVESPGYKESKKGWLKDVAVVTGADLLGGLYGISLERAELSNLGKAKKIIVDKNETQIYGGRGNKKLIAARLAILRQVQQTDSYDHDRNQERIANLIGSTAVIRIGGPTPIELRDNEYKVATAMQSVKFALEYGYVLGGGLTYYNAKKSLDREIKLKSLNQAEKVGIRIVQQALEQPMRCLLATGRQSIEDFEKNTDIQPEFGYNLIAKKYESFREAGIWDSLALVQYALQIALSHAKMILETTSWDTVKPDLPFL